MNNNKTLVCFLGMKTCGKDFNSQPYIKAGFKKIALADTLRDMLWEIIGFGPTEEIPYDDYKKCILTTEVTTKKFGFIPWLKEFKITTIRKMMQNIGSVMKKYFGENFWVNLWYDKVVQSGCNVVCTDCRFTNEVLKALELKNHGYNVTFIWVCYEKADFNTILADTHESEKLAQFIYYNQYKYRLHDLCVIKEDILRQILADFEQYSIEMCQ